MENKSISLKLIKNKADKSLTLQLNFVKESYLINMAIMALEKYL